MASIGGQDFIRGSDQRQAAVLLRTGVGMLVVIAVVVTAVTIWYQRSSEPDGLRVAVVVDELGPGVTRGTKVMLRGTEVGEITEIDPVSGGPITVNMRIREDEIAGLTTNFGVDFRPRNYFGTTAINLAPQAGGAPVHDGLQVVRGRVGDFTMSTMLLEGSLVVDGSLTTEMVQSLDKAVRYSSAMTPMIETGIVIADQVARTQQALPSEQLRRFNDIMAEMPAFSRGLVQLLDAVYGNEYNRTADGAIGVDDAFMDETDAGLTLASGQLFGLAGSLLDSHGTQLTPLITTVARAVDVLPHLMLNGATPARVEALVARYSAAFTGPDGQPTLRLRVVLNDLPGVNASLSALAAQAANPGGR